MGLMPSLMLTVTPDCLLFPTSAMLTLLRSYTNALLAHENYYLDYKQTLKLGIFSDLLGCKQHRSGLRRLNSTHLQQIIG